MNRLKWFLVKLIVKNDSVIMNVRIDGKAIKKGWCIHGPVKSLITPKEAMKSGVWVDYSN